MAKAPDQQQKTDAERVGEGGTGKLDDTKNKDKIVRQTDHTHEHQDETEP